VMVSCSKVIKRDEHMMDEACKIVSILERKYGKIAHRSVSPDPECPGAWEIDFYDSVPTRYEGVNEYELKRFISVMLVPVKGYESRAVTLAIVAQAMDLQSGDIERSLDDPINAL